MYLVKMDLWKAHWYFLNSILNDNDDILWSELWIGLIGNFKNIPIVCDSSFHLRISWFVFSTPAGCYEDDLPDDLLDDEDGDGCNHGNLVTV